MTLVTSVRRECCIAEHSQAVPHSVRAERYCRTRSISQDIHRFPPNIVAYNGDINMKYWSNYFHSTFSYFFNAHFNIILKHIHSQSSRSVCCQQNKWNILLLHKLTLIKLLSELMCITSACPPPQTPYRCSSDHWSLSAKIINQAQFVITTAALIYIAENVCCWQ